MISVAMCSYNGEKYIEEQIKSILAQTVPVDEIVICDDRSNDRTIEIISQIKGDNTSKTEICFYVNETNLGVTKNFEKALSLCRGDIVFLSDQDDVWVENKVEITLDILEKHKNCQLVFTDVYLVDANGEDLGKRLWELTNPPVKDTYSIRDFLGLRFVTGATVALRKVLLEHTLPIPEYWIHDAWLAANASVYGDVKSINKPLIMYRQHEKNVIGAKKRSLVDQIRYTRVHISDSKQFRTTMKNRFLTLYENCMQELSSEEKTAVEKCVEFWKVSENLSENGKLKGVRTIYRNFCNGNYKKYNHGIYGAGVDLMILTALQESRELG